MISYQGIFFEGETVNIIHSLEECQLPIVNDEIHCTFKYHPTEEELFDDVVGKEVEIELIGYACDGKNSGFQIELSPDITGYYINFDEDNPTKLKIPHITTSLAKGAKAKDTKNLNFKPLLNPYKIKGKFGYWIKDGDHEYISYEPYNVIKR